MTAIAETETNQKYFTGSTLKLIAIITMFIDHIGAAILENSVISSYIISHTSFTPENWLSFDLIFRLTGRIAFPIFCFLLVEGFLHTKNVKKYALRLGMFCLISEIPFDLAFYQQPFSYTHQNVFFTLLIGLLVLIGLKQFEGASKGIFRILCVLAGALVATFLQTDYSAYGVCVIVLFYIFRKRPIIRNISTMLVLFLCSPLEITGIAALIPIHLYNGKRGSSIKYFFYLFYPLHLLLLYGIGQLLTQWLLR